MWLERAEGAPLRQKGPRWRRQTGAPVGGPAAPVPDRCRGPGGSVNRSAGRPEREAELSRLTRGWLPALLLSSPCPSLLPAVNLGTEPRVTLQPAPLCSASSGPDGLFQIAEAGEEPVTERHSSAAADTQGHLPESASCPHRRSAGQLGLARGWKEAAPVGARPGARGADSRPGPGSTVCGCCWTGRAAGPGDRQPPVWRGAAAAPSRCAGRKVPVPRGRVGWGALPAALCPERRGRVFQDALGQSHSECRGERPPACAGCG